MFKKFCCKFGIILEAIWQHKIDTKRSSGGRKLSQIEGKIVTMFLVNWTFFFQRFPHYFDAFVATGVYAPFNSTLEKSAT